MLVGERGPRRASKGNISRRARPGEIADTAITGNGTGSVHQGERDPRTLNKDDSDDAARARGVHAASFLARSRHARTCSGVSCDLIAFRLSVAIFRTCARNVALRS